MAKLSVIPAGRRPRRPISIRWLCLLSHIKQGLLSLFIFPSCYTGCVFRKTFCNCNFIPNSTLNLAVTCRTFIPLTVWQLQVSRTVLGFIFLWNIVYPVDRSLFFSLRMDEILDAVYSCCLCILYVKNDYKKKMR